MAIIVGDVHGNIEKVKSFLSYKPQETHVALGDYLDSYVEPIERQLQCLQLLMDSKAVLLLGNHECHYLKKPLFQFPGYQLNHADVLQDFMETNLYRFKAAYAVDGWLCTHAGANGDITGTGHNEESLSALFSTRWLHYIDDRFKYDNCRYLYQSIFYFNHCIYVEGNLLPENIKQIFGHMEHTRPIVENNYIALDTTNFSNSCWLYDTETSELVQLPLDSKSAENGVTTENDCKAYQLRIEIPAEIELVARFQSKELLSGMEQYAVIELDFAGVEYISQAFADEIFRVWPLKHPETRLVVVNAGEWVRKMYYHVRGRVDLPQPCA